MCFNDEVGNGEVYNIIHDVAMVTGEVAFESKRNPFQKLSTFRKTWNKLRPNRNATSRWQFGEFVRWTVKLFTFSYRLIFNFDARESEVHSTSAFAANDDDFI